MRDETASVVAPVTSQPRADSSIDGNSHVTRAVCMVQNFPDNTVPECHGYLLFSLCQCLALIGVACLQLAPRVRQYLDKYIQ